MIAFEGNKIITTRRALTVFLALLPFRSVWANPKRLPRTPITLPFAAAKKGTILIVDFEATQEIFVMNVYYFSLNLVFNGLTDRNRVSHLAGSGAYNSLGSRMDNGIPIPLKLTINRMDSSGESVIHEKEVYDEELESYGDNSFTKRIDSVDLPPGTYRIQVEALNDVPDLMGTPIEFMIYRRRV